MTLLQDNLTPIIKAALDEDIGAGDITSELLIPEAATASMNLVAREPMVMCGGFVPAAVYEQLDADVIATCLVEEGAYVDEGAALVSLSGNARALLTGERVVLNLMQRMCGIASLTKHYVDAVAGTNAVILDTRKTMPGLRMLDKYAVNTGGATNHRMRLDDMVLIKDNHIGLHAGADLKTLVEDVKSKATVPVVVECDTLEQLQQVLAAKPDRIMLDNMELDVMKQAVALAGGEVPLEATGGVSLESVRAIAETGVDYISVGKLTHSAPSVDIGADIVITNPA